MFGSFYIKLMRFISLFISGVFVFALTQWSVSSQADIELPLLGENANINLQKEHELGLGLYDKLKQGGYIVEDSLLSRYVSDIGNDLLSHLDVRVRDYTFFLVKDASVNAFAAPGGYIGINFGLISLCRSEDELASVLAHEIAHVELMHSMQMIEKAEDVTRAGMMSLLAAILVSGYDSDLAGALVYTGTAGSHQAMTNFTRVNEYEADRVGIELLKKSDYQSSAMADFMQRMQEIEQTGELSSIEYIRTHPVSSNRIAELQARVEENKKPRRSSRFQQFKDYLFYVYPDYAKVIKPSRFSQALEYSRNGDYLKAEQMLQKLLKSDEDNIWYGFGLAQNWVSRGEYKKAMEYYQSLSHLYPEDNAITEQLVGLWLKLKRPHDALEELNRMLTYNEAQPKLYALLVKVYRQLGNDLQVQIAQADYHWFNDNKEQAKRLYEALLAEKKLDALSSERIKEKLDKQ